MMKTCVVKNNYARMLSGYFPDRPVKQRIVSDVINTNAGAIKFRPRHAFNVVSADFRMTLKGRIPPRLIGPDSNIRTSRQRGQQALAEMPDVRGRRW